MFEGVWFIPVLHVAFLKGLIVGDASFCRSLRSAVYPCSIMQLLKV